MKTLFSLLLLLAACAQTPKQEGWQDTPTTASHVQQPIVIKVVSINFFGWSLFTITDLGGMLDQSGAVGGGTARGQRADQSADVDAELEIPAKLIRSGRD